MTKWKLYREQDMVLLPARCRNCRQVFGVFNLFVLLLPPPLKIPKVAWVWVGFYFFVSSLFKYYHVPKHTGSLRQTFPWDIVDLKSELKQKWAVVLPKCDDILFQMSTTMTSSNPPVPYTSVIFRQIWGAGKQNNISSLIMILMKAAAHFS